MKTPLAISLVASFIGFVIGTLLGGGSILPEFIQRMRWSWSGGGGESADWGEPLFYFFVMGVPIGMLVCVGTFVLSALVLWLLNKSGQ